jgi:predicted N-acetyltransferase YhbS
MELIIRKTDKREHYQSEVLTRETFWNLYEPGCTEHLVLNRLRNSNSYICELDLIAIYKNDIIGHIISTKAKVLDSHNNEHEILCVGPLAILPDFQKNGVGSRLINESIRVAKKLGYLGMILFGNPDYYHRFGFVNAEKYRITTKDNQNFEQFMALEINENSLTDVSGCFFEDKSFSIEEFDLNEFEKQFPFKEKQVSETQFKH